MRYTGRDIAPMTRGTTLRWPRPQVPGLRAARDWRHHGARDLVAGIAVAAYLVPQCLAYARLAGVEPVNGLWAAMPALVVYALLGTSALLSVGPESASALLVGSAVSTLSASGNTEAAEIAAALALAVAAVSLVAWLARLGFLADLLSRPVLVGYLAGVAVTMVASQMPNLAGVSSSERDPLPRAVDVIGKVDEWRAGPLILGGGVVVALFGLQRLRRVPAALIVVLTATAVTAIFDLEEHGVATLGDVPRGLPSFAFPSIPARLWPGVFGAAAGIAVVAFSGNVLTGRAFARNGDQRVDPDQEWIALGGANAIVGVLHGFPVSSSDSRTALARAAGGSSQLTSVVAAACIALVLLVASPVLEAFPLAGLGALVVYAGARLIDVREMRRIVAFRTSEAVIMAAAFVGVVAFDLLIGIGVAVALSVADLLRRIARAHDAVQGIVPDLAGLHDIEDYPNAKTIPGLVVYRYDAPLCFANVGDFRRRVLDAIDDETTPVEWVLLNMEANVEIDLSATDMLEELRQHLESRGIVLALARVKQDLAVYLRRTGLAGRIGDERIFPTLPTALEGFERRARTSSG
jgi:high affinity sulfate transporter 1